MKRTLTPEEAALWKRVAETVRPLRRVPPRHGEGDHPQAGGGAQAGKPALASLGSAAPAPPPPLRGGPPPRAGEELRRARPNEPGTLDSTWDRKLGKGVLQPDFTLDLHGHTLDSAHSRLEHGLTQALAQGARVLLLITGKSRAAEDINARGQRRGAIRAKFVDWLANGPHASKIAAIRPAHPRHGGAGAVYIVLKRPR